MAFGFFMNMERLSLDIAKEHINNMTKDNTDTAIVPFLDQDKLLNNLKNGFVAITQLNCYIESFLNTIISYCIGYEADTLLKCSIQEKIDLIFLHYGKSFSVIKTRNCWALYKETTSVRNSIIHYKKAYVGDAGGMPDFYLSKKCVGTFFTQQNMQILYSAHIELAKLIAAELDLTIYEGVNVFECDGSSCIVNYVFDKKMCLNNESYI